MPERSPPAVNSCSLTGTNAALNGIHQTPFFWMDKVLRKYALYGLRFPVFSDRKVIIPEKTVIIQVVYAIFTSEIVR